MKKNKNIIYVCLIALGVVALGAILLLTLGQKKDWSPEVRGSHVLEISYENMENEYVAEKFADFSAFSKSKWADYNFISQAKAKDERYSKEYFKNSDLIVIKFNMSEKGIAFTVTDVSVKDNVCTVELLPVKRISKLEKKQTTYCCFVETKTDISAFEVKLSFRESVSHESQEFSYITENNEYYTFEGQTEPTAFVIDSKNGIEQFFEHDGVLSKQSLIYVQLKKYSDEVFAEYSLMLVRLPSSDFEQLAVYYEGNTLRIVGTYSNHYLYKKEKETKHHKLVALLIPKDLSIDTASRTVYYEYEDNLAEKIKHSEFSLEEPSNLASNLKKYSFVNKK